MVNIANTKAKMAQPKITTTQMLLFGLLTGWLIVSNLIEFYAISFMWESIITITFYIAIMLTAGQRGSISDLVKQLISIIVSPEPDETKMIKLQNLIVALCQELGILYEKEKEKFFEHLAEVSGEPEAISLLKTQIAEIEEKLGAINQ